MGWDAATGPLATGPLATGLGSWPGRDVVQAVQVVAEQLPELPHVPELPARGPAAGMIGRTAALLPDLPVGRNGDGWALLPPGTRAGRDQQQAVQLLTDDLDALGQLMQGYRGWLKLQLVGPWTLAAHLELPRGGLVVADHGAVSDVVSSLAQALAEHASQVARRVPGARLVVQLDEPSLPAVLAGRIQQMRGLATYPAVQPGTVREGWQQVLQQVSGLSTVLHCCAAQVPVGLVREAGFDAVSLDVGLLGQPGGQGEQALAAAWEVGMAVFAGVIPSVAPPSAAPSSQAMAASATRQVQDLLHRCGDGSGWLARTVITPTCGLAGASPTHARAALDACRQAAAALARHG